MATYTERICVDWVDTDASGRIHYTAAMRYFERAEHRLVRQLFDGKLPQEIGLEGFPRVHVELDMMAALTANDMLDCTVKISNVGTSAVTFEFSAVRLDGLPCLRGKIIAVAIDKNGLSTPLPEDFRRVFLSALSTAS